MAAQHVLVDLNSIEIEGGNPPRRLRKMSNNDDGHERWRQRAAVGVIVAIIVIIIAAVVTIRSRSIILRFDKHTILDAGPHDMTVA